MKTCTWAGAATGAAGGRSIVTGRGAAGGAGAGAIEGAATGDGRREE